MITILKDPEQALRNAAKHVRYGYAWFYSDRAVTIPASDHLLYLADEIKFEVARWNMIMARS